MLQKHRNNEHYVGIIGRFVVQNIKVQMPPMMIVCAAWEHQNGQVRKLK